MKAAAVLAALVVVAAAVQEPGEATGDAPSSSYSSAVVHDESSAAPTTEGEGVLPQDWAYSHVHIQFPSKDSDKPRARGKKPRRRPEQSTARPVPKQPEAAGQSDESSPATSRSRQDVGVSSVNLGYSIGVALTPEDLRVTSSSQTAGAGDQAHPSAHSYSVSNLGLAQRPLGEVITGRPAGTQVQEGSARAAQHQGPTGHPPAQRSAHDQATGQFSLRNTAGRQNSGSSVSSAPFRNDLQDVQLHSQLAQQNQNGNNNALGHGLNGGYNGLFGGGIPAHSGAPQSNVHTANNAPNSGQSTPQAKTNNHLLIHNYKNFQSGVLSRGNQLQNNLAHGKTLSQTYPNNADKIKTNFHGVQQPHNHNNANVHNFSNVYNTLVGNSNHAHSLSPSKTVYPAFVNNVENVQRNGQSAQQVLNNNIQAQSAVNSYRPFDGYSKQVQSQILGNKQLQYNDNGEANNQHSNTLNNFNSNNFHNRNPVSSERYLENERNHANTEHVNNPNSGIFHTTFNIQKSQERNPDISTSSTNEQLAISIQSKPVSFGSMSGDNRNVGNISWRDMDSGMVMNSENTAQRHTPYNGGIMSLSSLASNQAMFYLDNGKQNNNVVHYTTTQNKGFNHENALGNSNIFDHKDAMVSQTQQTNNIQQSTHNQINHNSASSGNGITLHQIPQFSNFDGRFSELTPNLNSDIRPQTNFGSVHTTVPQATNNHNSASSSNKDISVLKATVLGVPGHAVLKQGDVPVFNINGLQPNPIYLNTGLLGYQTSHGGQNSNSPQNNGNFASLPGLIFPFSGTSGLINTNSNNILAASNSQHLASHVVPLSTHGSQSSTSVSHPAGQVALGRHNLPQSYSTGQSSYVSNFPIKLIQVPQFVNSGTPSSPGGNANTANFQFLNYQNLLPGIAQQQHIQLEKGPIQEVPTTNNNQDLNSQVQVNSQSQLPNIQLLFPPPFQQISPANHDTQKNTNGVNIHPNNSQLRLQGVNNLEGQPHIYQGRENIPKDVPFSNLVYSAGGQPGYNTVSVQSGAQTQQYGPGGSVRLGSGDEWRGAVDTASQEISSSRHVSGDSLQGLGQTPGALRHGSGDSHQGLGELYLGQTPGALRHVSGDSHQGLGALYVMSPPGALRHGRGRGQRKLGSQAVKPVTEPSEEMDGSESPLGCPGVQSLAERHSPSAAAALSRENSGPGGSCNNGASPVPAVAVAAVVTAGVAPLLRAARREIRRRWSVNAAV
ncbi:putative uncharacterized protein DDB_G0286901 [Bacillus rossius redtenbacheri]|uniref:putative uncharacterized protein DDB_G0286901 n=1 Tax=Bacillus rossius redtenbacheri TaxID=93214 RepID=UPI002FDD6502